MAAPQSPRSNFFFFLLTLAAAQLHIADAIQLQVAKQTNLVFYGHEYLSGPNTSVIISAGKNGPIDSNLLEFGTVLIHDDTLTEGPSPESKEIGRAQGFYINSQLDGKAMYMSFSVVFSDGEFKGSTLQIQGADVFTEKQRECAIVSGTGHFRFVMGYGIMETEEVDTVNMRVSHKINITVYHLESPSIHQVGEN